VSVKFLGQYLIQQRAITAEQLRQALAHLERSSVPIGQLAVEAGYLSDDDVERFSEEEAATGKPMTELFADLALLTPQQLDELLNVQHKDRQRLGHALVRLGFLSPQQLAVLLRAFDEDQAPYRAGASWLPDDLVSHAAARAILSLLPKLTSSITGVSMRVVRATHDVDSHPYRASVMSSGACPLRIELATDRGLARVIARGLTGDSKLDPEEWELTESLGELLNVIVGNAVAAMEESGVHLKLLPPEHGCARFRGTPFELVTAQGIGVLFLDPAPELLASSLELESDEA
jgi:hypothetical protein